MSNKYLFVFAIVIFLLLSITGAGIFLNDEWLVAQQLHQVSQGHQVLYNEGKYGYFMNGTPSDYVTARDNILIYSMAVPIISLPMSFLFSFLGTDYTRLAIITLWSLLGFFCIIQIRNEVLKDIVLSALVLSFIPNYIFWYSSFPMSGQYVPYEIIPIVMTNILIMGIFSVISFKLCELLFEDKIKQIVGWIMTISCTSLLFWAGTLKDHVLLSTIILAICYFQIQYMKTQKYEYLIYASLLAGFSAWIRPEVGLFVAISLIIFNLYYIRRTLLTFVNMGTCIIIGSSPLFLNNYFVTGDPFKSVFLMARGNGVVTNLTSGNMVDVITTATKQIPFAQLTEANYEQWGKLFFAPESGAVGCLVMISIFLFSILTIIRYRQKVSTESKLLLIIGIGCLGYYLLFSGAYLGRDGGVIPDIRYLTPSYALFSLFALSVIPYKLNYRKILKNIFISIPIVLIISLFIISGYTPIGETYKTFRIIPEIIAVATFSIMSLILVNHRKTESPLLEKIIPIAIASSLSWQMIMIFIYHTSKAHYYPMFIPIVEMLYKLIFGA